MRLSKIVTFFNEIAPGKLQEDYDNSGLLIGDVNNEISKAITIPSTYSYTNHNINNLKEGLRKVDFGLQMDKIPNMVTLDIMPKK